MKQIIHKSLILFFVLGVVTLVSACSQPKSLPEISSEKAYEDAKIERKEKQEKLTVDSFCEKVKGFWGYRNGNGIWEILEFRDGKISDYTYAGHFWLSDGNIDLLEEISSDSVRISVSYNEIIYGENEVPTEPKTTEYIFSSTDNFTKNLMYDEREYIYLCENNLDETINDLLHSQIERGLPLLYDFENNLKRAIIDFYKKAGMDAIDKGYIPKDFKIDDMEKSGANYEHMIMCTYGPNKVVGLNGTANNNEVEYVFSFIPLIGMNVDGEGLAAMATMVMIPAGLFDENYSSYDGLYNLMTKLVQSGSSDEKGESKTLVINDIEYTLTVSNSMIGFTVNARDKQY